MGWTNGPPAPSCRFCTMRLLPDALYVELNIATAQRIVHAGSHPTV
ncbi:hypothetical protein Z945_3501 [Sulfitobacter noctilucae]|nr:hypothetical protein Z945_3501 [Sulfitobacter noctilucae]